MTGGRKLIEKKVVILKRSLSIIGNKFADIRSRFPDKKWVRGSTIAGKQ